MPIKKHRKSNSNQQKLSKQLQQQQQQPPQQPPAPPSKQQPQSITTTTTTNSNSNSNQDTSTATAATSTTNNQNISTSTFKPSIFSKSHHTLLAVASLSNLRNSNHHHTNHHSSSSNESSIIKRSNSIGENILKQHHFHYITHSNSSNSKLSNPSSESISNQTTKSSFTSSFNKPVEFFKRSHHHHHHQHLKPSSNHHHHHHHSNNLSQSSLDLEVLSTSHDSNQSSTSPSPSSFTLTKKLTNNQPTTTSTDSINHHHRFNLKSKSVNLTSSSIPNQLSIQSESINSSSSTSRLSFLPSTSPSKKTESLLTKKIETYQNKHIESLSNQNSKSETSLKIDTSLNKKNESNKKSLELSNKKNESNKKSLELSNKKNESNKKSLELSNKKNESTKKSLELLNNKKNESISNLSSLGLFSGNSTTSLVSTTSSSTHHHTMNFSNNSNNSSTKPVIRHMTSTSTLASTNLSLNGNAFGSKSDPNFGMFLGNGGEPGGGGSLVLRPGDIWSQIVIRVIPLFNGEGHKGFIEDLNDFVTQHISKTISDSPSKSITKLTSDLQELFTSGVMSLNHKFSPDSLTDERFLIRVMEIWHFFFTGVLPTLEAIFLPLMTDEKLISVLESKNNKLLQERLQQIHLLQQVSATSGLPPSSTSLLFKTQPKPNEKLTEKLNIGIEVRKLALISFRDSMINTIFNRLYKLFSHLYDESFPSLENLSIDLVSEISHFKRLQMIGLLCGSVPNEEIEALGKLIRCGKADPKYLKEEDSSSTTSNTKKNGSTGTIPNPPGNALSLSPTIRHWNKNREFTRRSIRRQLRKPSHHHSPSSSRSVSSNLKAHFEFGGAAKPPASSDHHHGFESFDHQHHHHDPNHSNSTHTNHSMESLKFSDHLKHVVQAKINKSINYFGSQSFSLDDHGSMPSPV